MKSANIRHFLLNILLAMLWAVFLQANLAAFIERPRLSLLLFVLTQTEFIIFLLLRKPPSAVSERWSDYLVAVAGTFIALIFQPAAGEVIGFGGIMQYAGDILIYVAVVLEITAFLSLNTSTGIAPANRGVKTRGLYQFVRHPVYASYLILYIGYVVNNFSLSNVLVLFASVMLQVLRIQNEEAVLAKDVVYAEYSAKVRWRLIPGIF